MLEILQGLQNCWTKNERAALATIVEIDGAAYRREGARCLILENGKIIGTLSGGCVEGDLLDYARTVMGTGEPQEIHYDFRSEGDLFWGLGVGCNGALTIWLQPFDPVHHPEQAQQQIQAFQKRASCLKAYTIGLVLESENPIKLPVGSHLALDREGDLCRLENDTINGVSVKLFVESVTPRPRLIIFGSGLGAVPIVQGAKSLNWQVTIIDHREDSLKQDGFLGADKCVLTSRNKYSEFSVIDEAYVVVMTHNYELDKILVQMFLTSSIPYLGVLGSRYRIERILQDIRLECGELREDFLKKLHSPIGLDIGAESPEEIALSILSELVCRKNGRSGQSLRLRKEPMHERRNAVALIPLSI
jgi:xanthine dehydrogenase accessory factor